MCKLVEQTFPKFLETSPALPVPNGGPGSVTWSPWVLVSSSVMCRVQLFGVPLAHSLQKSVTEDGLGSWVGKQGRGAHWVGLNEGTIEWARVIEAIRGEGSAERLRRAEVGVGLVEKESGHRANLSGLLILWAISKEVPRAPGPAWGDPEETGVSYMSCPLPGKLYLSHVPEAGLEEKPSGGLALEAGSLASSGTELKPSSPGQWYLCHLVSGSQHGGQAGRDHRQPAVSRTACGVVIYDQGS